MDFKGLLIKQERWEGGMVLRMVRQLTDDLTEETRNAGLPSDGRR